MTSLLALLALIGCVRALDGWEQYKLVWQDDFNFLDTTKWQYEVTAAGGGNNEFQLYTPDPTNSYVRDSKLFIRPTLLADARNPQTGQPYGQQFLQQGTLDVARNYGACTNPRNGGCYRTGAAGNIPPIMSARLRSFQKFSFTYGRVVIRAKMPVGDWVWPAIWMLPENWIYGGWPRSGEIDIVEIIGNRDLQCGQDRVGIERAGVTLHWGPSPQENRFWKTHLYKLDTARNFGDNFHTYILDWSPNGLRFFIDDEVQALLDVPYPLVSTNPGWRGMWEWGKPWQSQDNPWARGNSVAPFDQAFHFLINVAVGGTGGFISDGCANRGGAGWAQKPWSNGDGYEAAMRKFNDARGAWKWTWDQEGENNALQIDYIRVFQQTG